MTLTDAELISTELALHDGQLDWQPIAWLCVDATHPVLPGHFPGRPLVPGVMLLARLQTLLSALWPNHQLARLPQVKFIRPVRADETVLLHLADVKVALRDQQQHVQGKFALRHAGHIVAQGTFESRATPA